MKYFRIGYCPPNPGWRASPYGYVRAYSEKEIDSAIEYYNMHKNMPIYMKPNYGAKYREISYDTLLKYQKI